MSLKYVGETALAENIAQEKIYIESIRAALDAAKQDVIQVTTLGTATADKVGIAYQYMGENTATLKHGWFYEVVEVTPATVPATYTWKEFEFGGGLPYSDTVPSNPSDGDVFLYTGTDTSTYKNGSIYQYKAGTLFYGWDKQSPYMTAYTLSETPSVNDAIYTSSGSTWGEYVVSYDVVNNAIEDNSGTVYTRNNSIDVVVGAGWTQISRYNIGDGLEVNTVTNTLSAKIATTHTLGMAKGGRGTMIGDYGEINVYQRLEEEGVGDPGSRVSLIYYDSGFRLNLEDNGDYKKGGIYELQINAVTPVGTENPNEEGWYEYDGSSWDYREYFLTEDTTVDSEKTYYTIAWVLVSANSQEFNTDDFEIENDVVSLDVTQRSFTGTQAEWEALTTAEKAKYTLVNIIDSYDTENILYADMPIGTIVPFGGAGAPTMFLLCDGSEVAKASYPELYEVIGDVFGTASDATLFRLPDLRECVPVGVGKNITKSIDDHDRYTLGQFKDDQLQNHDHNGYLGGANQNLVGSAYSGVTGWRVTADGAVGDGGAIAYLVQNANGRFGTTTHGKQLGVNYIIKAKESGMPTDVTEGVRDVVSEMEGYSTAETDTGKTWIDGKPIYRKVYTGLNITTAVSGWHATDIDASDIDCIVHSQMIGIDSGAPYSENEIECNGMIAVNKNTEKLDIITVGYIVYVKKIVLEYTKIT